jgi:hypothetical protein
MKYLFKFIKSLVIVKIKLIDRQEIVKILISVKRMTKERLFLQLKILS